jgi:hypothetical protein
MVAVPREIVNHVPANKLKMESKTRILFGFVNRFATNKLNPIISNADGKKTVPKFKISNRVKTNKIEPVRNRTEPITIPV